MRRNKPGGLPVKTSEIALVFYWDENQLNSFAMKVVRSADQFLHVRLSLFRKIYLALQTLSDQTVISFPYTYVAF
jgi:hypothetical protein